MSFFLKRVIFAALLLVGITSALASSKGPPTPKDGGPVEVRFAMAVLDVDEISDSDQNFTVNVFTLIRWHDPREAHNEKGSINKSLEDVWHPRFIFSNRQRIWSSLANSVDISSDGEVTYRQHFWGDFSQPMNLRNFPFDTQEFKIQVVSPKSKELGNLKFVNDFSAKSFVTKDYSVADWVIVDFETDTSDFELREGISINSFVMKFTAKRLSDHYVIKVIAPLLMIVLLSWVVFWLSPSEGASQLGVAVTSFLTMIAYHVALNANLPEISYLTRLDLFVFCSTMLVFLAMIEVVITTGLAQKGRIDTARRLDRICRLVFPGLLAVGAFFAFFWS